MDVRYPATLERQKDGTFFVQFVDLPDTFTQGQTKEQALFSAAEVLSAMLARRLENPTHWPSLKTLDRAAAARGKRLVLTLE